ncbi:MAG: matrixin family metalloprotease [Myxococcales bacterium]|nr:matrixin family metalloprotease [Myxococcales bacterium]
MGPEAVEDGEDARPYIPIAVNTSNNVGLSGHEVERAVVESMLSWQAASGQAFRFDVWAGTDPELFPAAFHEGGDGYTTVHFSSRNAGAGLSARQAGFTELTFDPETGAILEGDVVLNDVGFGITVDPELSTYAADGLLGKTMFLDDVVAHELGHMLGLHHTAVADSTMFSRIWTGQDSLGCDDVRGMRELYQAPQSGGISGRVDVEGAREWAGVEVMAIGVRQRGVVAATFTDIDGNYAIGGLLPDRYLLVAAPYRGEAAELPMHLEQNFGVPCPASRGFSEAVTVDSGESQQVDFVLPCDGGADLPSVPSTLKFPIDLVPDEEGRVIGAYRVDPGPDDTFVRVTDVDGLLSVDILSHSLFSAGRVQAEALSAEGGDLGAELLHPLVRSADAPTFDSRLEVFAQDRDVVLAMKTALLPPQFFPGGPTFVDERSYAVVVGVVADYWQGLDGCEAAELPPYASPGGVPVQSWEVEKKGGCTTSGAPGGGWLWLGVLGALGARRRSGPISPRS